MMLRQFLLFLFLLICSLSCSLKKTNERSDVIQNRIESIKKEHVGKNLNIIHDIIEDSIRSGFKLVLLISNGDCGGCIEKGFNVLKTLAEIKNISFYTISSGINTNFFQQNYSYEKYIFPDDNDLIRRNLSYCFTPVIIILDSNDTIISMFFPQKNTKQVDELIEIAELLP